MDLAMASARLKDGLCPAEGELASAVVQTWVHLQHLGSLTEVVSLDAGDAIADGWLPTEATFRPREGMLTHLL